MQFAVDVLKVKHILVVGHYGCGGVRAALAGKRLGLIDNWLRHVEDVRDKHRSRLEALAQDDQGDQLCELNVIEQVVNVCQTTVVKDAWTRGQDVTVHGWVYGLNDGIVTDLNVSADSPESSLAAYRDALGKL